MYPEYKLYLIEAIIFGIIVFAFIFSVGFLVAVVDESYKKETPPALIINGVKYLPAEKQ